MVMDIMAVILGLVAVMYVLLGIIIHKQRQDYNELLDSLSLALHAVKNAEAGTVAIAAQEKNNAEALRELGEVFDCVLANQNEVKATCDTLLERMDEVIDRENANDLVMKGINNIMSYDGMPKGRDA